MHPDQARRPVPVAPAPDLVQSETTTPVLQYESRQPRVATDLAIARWHDGLNDDERLIYERLVTIICEQTAIDRTQVRPGSRFIQDLGMG